MLFYMYVLIVGMNILGDKGFHPSLTWGPQIINKAKPERIKSASVQIMNRHWKWPAWVQT